MTQRQSQGRVKDKKKVAKCQDEDEQLLTAQGAQGDRSEYYKACIESIDSIRPYFDGRALRRTIRSKSNDGSLWTMPDPTIITLGVKLHAHEYDVLELAAKFAREIAKRDTTWRSVRKIVIHMSFDADPVQSFYLDARKAVLHVFFRDQELFHNVFTSREEYNRYPSAKINALIAIIQYHQAASGRPPLHLNHSQQPDDDETDLNPLEASAWSDFPPSIPMKKPPPTTPDKIIVYIGFPEHNVFLNAVRAPLFISFALY